MVTVVPDRKIYKKDSGIATATYAQALDVARCWGWIDGPRKIAQLVATLEGGKPIVSPRARRKP